MLTYSVRRCLLSGLCVWGHRQSRLHKLAMVRFSHKGEAKEVKNVTAYHLKDRSVVQLCGRDTVDLLQGLVTSDVTELSQTKDPAAQFSMMLNVQGRVLYDLILYNNSKTMEVCFLVECDSSLKEDFMKAVKRYRIRKKVDVADVSSEYQVWSLPSDLDPSQAVTAMPGTEQKTADVPKAVMCLPDPRVPLFGHRVIFKQGEESLASSGSEDEYQELRYKWGIPEGPVDLPPGNCLPLECNLVFMNGVSFTKGCYIGQELTARTHHTGVIRKRLVPIAFDSPPPQIPADAQICTEKGKNAGKVRSTVGKHGLGLLRLQHQGEPLSVQVAEQTRVQLTTYRPCWWPADIQI